MSDRANTVSKDGIEPKNTQTRVVGTITDEMHPYTFFIYMICCGARVNCNRVSMKNV